jgi:ribosome-binding protein aMBF1 (putative translation factor)
MTLGYQVKTEREKQGLSQSTLHHKADISLDTLRRIEKDRSKNPSYYVISKLEKALGIKLMI